MAPQIFLDSAIREWVLVPVFVAMFLFGVLRAQVSKVRAAPTLDSRVACVCDAGRGCKVAWTRRRGGACVPREAEDRPAHQTLTRDPLCGVWHAARQLQHQGGDGEDPRDTGGTTRAGAANGPRLHPRRLLPLQETVLHRQGASSHGTPVLLSACGLWLFHGTVFIHPNEPAGAAPGHPPI